MGKDVISIKLPTILFLIGFRFRPFTVCKIPIFAEGGTPTGVNYTVYKGPSSSLQGIVQCTLFRHFHPSLFRPFLRGVWETFSRGFLFLMKETIHRSVALSWSPSCIEPDTSCSGSRSQQQRQPTSRTLLRLAFLSEEVFERRSDGREEQAQVEESYERALLSHAVPISSRARSEVQWRCRITKGRPPPTVRTDQTSEIYYCTGNKTSKPIIVIITSTVSYRVTSVSLSTIEFESWWTS